MRCLGCHTVLMDGDTRCPSCGKSQGTNWGAAEYDPVARSKLINMKWTFGILGPLIGGLMMLGGGAYVYSAHSNRPELRKVTGEELAKIEKIEDMPGWIVVEPEHVIYTQVRYARGSSGATVSKFVLIKAGDRWMVAHVPPQYKGGRIEGQLKRLDHLALPWLQQAFPDHTNLLLPSQLEAEYDLAGSVRQDAIFGYGTVGFGLLFFAIGLGFLFMKTPPPIGTATPSSAPPTAPRGQTLLKSSVLLEGAPQVTQMQPPRQSRGCLFRGFFMVVWGVVFFMVGIVICAVWMAMKARDEAEMQLLSKQVGEQVFGWLCLGSILVPIILGKFGWLPGTRK